MKRYKTGTRWWLLIIQILLFPCAYARNKPDTVIDKRYAISQDIAGYDTAAIAYAIEHIYQVEFLYPDSCLKTLQELYIKSRQIGFLKGMGGASAEMGAICFNIGKNDLAKVYLSRALLYPALTVYIKANAVNNLGTVYEQTGEYDKAMLCYKKAMAYGEEHRFESVPDDAYLNFIELLMNLTRYKEAIYYLDKLEERARRENKQRVLLACMLNRGAAYGILKRNQEADSVLRKALVLAKANHFAQFVYAAYMNLGDSYMDKKDTTEAFTYFDSARSLVGILSPVLKIGYYNDIGGNFYRMKRYKDAIGNLEQALSFAQQIGNRDILITHYMLAEAYRRTADYKKATDEYRQYIALKDSLQDIAVMKNVNEYEVKFRTAEKDKELFQKQIALEHQQNLVKERNILLGVILAGALAAIAVLLSLYRAAVNKRKLQKRDFVIGQLMASVAGEEKERSRIGRELHDGISGMLTAANMNIVAIQHRHNDTPAMQELDEIIKMLQNVSIEVRKMAHNLIPDYLLEHNMPEILESYITRLNKTERTKFHVACYGELDDLNKTLVMVLYRMIQELTHNIIRHAHARNAEIQVRRHDNILSITIEDDGVGFDTAALNESVGLRQVQARVDALGGHISIDSKLKQGTTIYIELNLGKIKNTFLP